MREVTALAFLKYYPDTGLEGRYSASGPKFDNEESVVTQQCLVDTRNVNLLRHDNYIGNGYS
jgi:hypothetical protein